MLIPLLEKMNCYAFLQIYKGSEFKTLIGRRSQGGGGIGQVITFSSTNSLKKQQNVEQSLQNNF